MAKPFEITVRRICKRPLHCFVVGIFAVFLLVGLALTFYSIGLALAEPEKYRAACSVGHAFQHALEEDHLAEAYSLTTDRFKSQLSLDEFRKLITRYPALKGPEGDFYEYDGKVEHDFGSSRFAFEVEVSNHGDSASYNYVIIMEGGEWKVDSLRFRW